MSATRIGGPWQEGKFIDHCVAKIEFGKAGEVEDIIIFGKFFLSY